MSWIWSFINNVDNLLIAGDFNVLVNKSDVLNFNDWQNDALGCIKSRKIFREILSSGLTNIVRIFMKPGTSFSYWDYQRACWERNDGLLIDHFLISPKYLKFVKNINFGSKYRGMTKPSDHIPIWINLDIWIIFCFFFCTRVCYCTKSSRSNCLRKFPKCTGSKVIVFF